METLDQEWATKLIKSNIGLMYDRSCPYNLYQ